MNVLKANYGKAAVLALCVPFLLALWGCPGTLIEQTEKLIPPPDYKPVYQTSTLPFQKILEMKRLRDSLARVAGKYLRDTAMAEVPMVITLQHRTLVDKNYPSSIEIRATVTDSAGKYISGLAPPYFQGKGDYRSYWLSLVDSCGGVATRIDSFSVKEVRQTSKEPHAVAMVVDHSGSMGSKRIQRLQEAVVKTLGIFRPTDFSTVISFAGAAHIVMPLTSDTTARKQLQPGKSWSEGIGGGTAIYDAVALASKELSKAPAGVKRVIILFTDGGDNKSSLTLEKSCIEAKAQGVTIHSINYGLTDERPLQKLSTNTNGKVYKIYATKEFPYVFSDIYRSLKNYYAISYTPPPCNDWHTVRYSLAIPDLEMKEQTATAQYNRTLFSELDTVGTIVLANIEFETAKSDIRPESYTYINDMHATLVAYPTMRIQIAGHTDSRGSAESNLQLSKQRAESVKRALVQKGIDADRLETKGWGADKPLAPNDTDENRARNRRTEFIILQR